MTEIKLVKLAQAEIKKCSICGKTIRVGDYCYKINTNYRHFILHRKCLEKVQEQLKKVRETFSTQVTGYETESEKKNE